MTGLQYSAGYSMGWRLVSRDALERLGVRVLPGPQRLGGEVVGALKGLLPVRVSL
ncbi:MAG: hypothetical protein QXU72_03190 [Thermofilum sp.]